MSKRPQAAYVHIPFCLSKCWYCDFSSYPGLESIFHDYVHALISEIERTSSRLPDAGRAGVGSDGEQCQRNEGPPPGPLRNGGGVSSLPDAGRAGVGSDGEQCRQNEGPPPGPLRSGGGILPGLDTVYFGGGTPPVLPARDLSAILNAIRDSLGIAEDAEVTIEANPGTVDEANLRDLREAGFNRLSLGVQSLDDDFLRAMGRVHTRTQAIEAYDAARSAGFANVGIDLIFALPGQTLAHWSNTLDSALKLGSSGRSLSRPGPDHISLYELSIEDGTRFAQLYAEGKLAPIDEDIQIAMYELAIEKLTSAGYEHYEVSNFARPGFRSRHNTVYWLNEPYYGFGAGATSYVDGTRARRIADPKQYIAAIASDSDTISTSETLDARARLGETVIMGLRMLDGVDVERVRRETGFDLLNEFAPQIDYLTERGLIECVNGHLRVTHAGLLLLNDVSREFV